MAGSGRSTVKMLSAESPEGGDYIIVHYEADGGRRKNFRVAFNPVVWGVLKVLEPGTPVTYESNGLFSPSVLIAVGDKPVS